MSVFEQLKSRGMIAQMTHEKEIKELLENEKITFYVGFDPTADSLHIGHFLQLMVMAHMQKAGHRPIALIGGGTGQVGDPSGRSDMRRVMTNEEIEHNCNCFKSQMTNIVDFSGENALMVNNADWLLKLNYIDFLRDIGTCFSVNKMLSAECFKSRLEKGLSFIEFNYMLMQSYDFLELNKNYECVLELGGDDQWSNIIAGCDLVRRKLQKDVYGMTFTLLTTSEGKKMGKSQNGAVWLDRNKTSPYEFFQYWRNIADADVIKCLKLLTFLSLDEIEKIQKDDNINKAKEILGYEVTKLVHGEQDAKNALEAAKAVFSGQSSENMPIVELSKSLFADGSINILELLTSTKLLSSKSEARRLIGQSGIIINDVKYTDVSDKIPESELDNKIIKKGKKTFIKIKLV